MIRSVLLQNLIPIISDELVISNIGLPSQELHMFDDQPSNFYMLGTMGLSSSIGLGLALAQSAKVIAIDGDGLAFCDWKNGDQGFNHWRYVAYIDPAFIHCA